MSLTIMMLLHRSCCKSSAVLFIDLLGKYKTQDKVSQESQVIVEETLQGISNVKNEWYEFMLCIKIR
jgi:tRNA isopentenyl-2-thiomethyl-A-37 hydroxylase MiaE